MSALRERYWDNVIDNIAAFDHKFFKMSSREAASADPQLRLLFQTAYQALEDARYFKTPILDGLAGQTHYDAGCFIGCATADYSENVASHPPTAYSAIGTLRSFSGRLRYQFGWSGPSIIYNTACSSSMVAIHSACRSVEMNECSLALAGGVNLITSPTCYQNLQAASFLSQTGATKAFDAKADGYCRGDGVGLIVLKSLRRALANGDRMHGVITASAINQSIKPLQLQLLLPGPKPTCFDWFCQMQN
jgi:acyl transferase domain-containing protein